MSTRRSHAVTQPATRRAVRARPPRGLEASSTHYLTLPPWGCGQAVHHLPPGVTVHRTVDPPRQRRTTINALLIPADPGIPCALMKLALTAAAFSDTIGGGLLDEALFEPFDGAGYCLYADLNRVERRLPPNPRIAELAARLGWVDLIDRAHLRGDLLIVGADIQQDDRDVPDRVIEAARRCGLLPRPTPDPTATPATADPTATPATPAERDVLGAIPLP